MPHAFHPPIPQLYHLAEAENLSSILKHGLLSTQRLVAMSGLSVQEQASLLRGHRRTHVRLPTGVLVRDQAPMPPSALGPALDDGMDPPDWYALLNGHVFLWPDRARMQRQRKACGSRPQVLLTFDAVALLDGLGEAALVTPINTGNARRRPARRGRTTLLPYQAWLRDGWPAGRRWRLPAEILFTCAVPVAPPYLIDVEEA